MLIRIILCIFIGRPKLGVRNQNAIELSFEYDIWGVLKSGVQTIAVKLFWGTFD